MLQDKKTCRYCKWSGFIRRGWAIKIDEEYVTVKTVYLCKRHVHLMKRLTNEMDLFYKERKLDIGSSWHVVNRTRRNHNLFRSKAWYKKMAD